LGRIRGRDGGPGGGEAATVRRLAVCGASVALQVCTLSHKHYYSVKCVKHLHIVFVLMHVITHTHTVISTCV
jgi:hypothetical protein